MKVLLGLALSCLTLAATEPLIEGNPKSPVRVVIYEDLQCSDCAAFRRMLDSKLLPRYGKTVAFEHRDFPLAKHAWARKAAIAARYLHHEAGPIVALEFRRTIMERIRAITPDNFIERFSAFAKRHAIDPGAAVAALDRPDLLAAVERDYQDGVARGVSRTPTAFVNGAPFIETFSFEEISKAIESALAESKS